MAWIDYSNSASGDYAYGLEYVDDSLFVDQSGDPWVLGGVHIPSSMPHTLINQLSTSYNLPGFDDGYQPAYVPNPITGNLGQPDPDGGGGGPSEPRPGAGIAWPR